MSIPTIKEESIVELFAMPEVADIDFEPPRLNKKLYQSENIDDFKPTGVETLNPWKFKNTA